MMCLRGKEVEPCKWRAFNFNLPYKTCIPAQRHNRKSRIFSVLKNFYIVDMTKEMVKFICFFNPLILLNGLFFNSLAHIAVEDHGGKPQF